MIQHGRQAPDVPLSTGSVGSVMRSTPETAKPSTGARPVLLRKLGLEPLAQGPSIRFAPGDPVKPMEGRDPVRCLVGTEMFAHLPLQSVLERSPLDSSANRPNGYGGADALDSVTQPDGKCTGLGDLGIAQEDMLDFGRRKTLTIGSLDEVRLASGDQYSAVVGDGSDITRPVPTEMCRNLGCA